MNVDTQAPSSLEEDVAALFADRHLDNPFPIWNRLREEAPIFVGNHMVIISRYADVKAMLLDTDHYSARKYTFGSRADAISAGLSDEAAHAWAELAKYDMSLADKDGADHDRLRGIAHRYFTPRRVGAMESTIQDAWDGLLGEAAKQGVYDHKHISQSLALRVITDIVGCPHVDAPYVSGLVDRLAQFMGSGNEDVILDSYRARLEFTEYINSVVVAEYRRNPDSNPFVRAMMDAKDEDNLSELELTAMVAVLLFGGIETTAVLLSNGLLELLRQRDRWAWLCEDPVGRVPDAVEEMFRYVSPAQFIPRTTAMDFELHGVEIPAWQTVIGSVAAANRDPDEYEKPETFDITRGRSHLGLGIGPHFCIGASVVRTEARIAFTGLASRYPDLELAVDPVDIEWTGPAPIRSVRELPIALGSARTT